MQKHLIGVFCLLSIVVAVNASDYFPVQIGNIWEFDYEYYQGHSRGGTTDLGTVIWTVSAIEQQDSAKKITIKQQRILQRRTLNMASYGGNYDSIYNPPREQPSEDITFIDSGNVVYWTFNFSCKQDTQVLIHDPNGTIPSGIVVRKNMPTIVNGSFKSALIVQNGTFSSKQCDNIGPVEFSDTVKIGINGRAHERWSLQSSPVSIKRELAQTQNVQIGNNQPQLTLINNESANPVSGSNLHFDLRGRTMTRLNRVDKKAKVEEVFISLPGNVKSGKQH